MNSARETPKSTVIAIVKKFSNNEEYILLTQRKVEPFKEKWCLPGGHINQDEIAIKAVKREVKEETGLDYFPAFYNYFDEIIPDEKIHAVVLIFDGISTGNLQKNNDEVKDAEWVSLPDSLNYDLAFQHKEVIKKYINRKLNKQKENAMLHELNYLRSEIENRFETRDKMIYYAIILAGIILAFGRIEGYILYPILGTVLAGLWSHSDLRIYEIADYIKNQIETNVPGLYWEHHLSDKNKKVKVKERKRQETYVLWVYIASYIIMILLSIIHIIPNIIETINNGSRIDVDTLKNILLISMGIIITSLCIYKTRKFITKRRKYYPTEKNVKLSPIKPEI